MHILAIDPGYDRCGWAILQKKGSQFSLIDKGCILTHKNNSMWERYSKIVKEVQEILSSHQVEEIAMESLFFTKNISTGIPVAQVRGVIITLAIQHNLSLFEYSPSQIKLAATGSGRADKKAVEKLVRLQLHLDPQEKIIDDTIDAMAVGITHFAIGKNTLPL